MNDTLTPPALEVTALPEIAVLEIAGADATTFLQNLTTNDVKALDHSLVQWNGLCTPKGRLYATFFLWKNNDRYHMLLSEDIALDVETRLRKYIMRAKVTIQKQEATLFALLGVNAREPLASLGLPALAANTFAAVNGGEGMVVALGDTRLVWIVPPTASAALWTQLTTRYPEAPSHRWLWWTIQAGFPLITRNTQEAFVPQMVNFDSSGGVSYTKGCYPGQEVVARAHYLGKIKRHMCKGTVHGQELPTLGDKPLSLFTSGSAKPEGIGQVVLLAPSPHDDMTLLAVMKEGGWENPLHLGTASGPVVEMAMD